MKKKIQHTIKPSYSVGNNELSDFFPLLISIVIAYFVNIPLGFKALIIYIGWEMTSMIAGIRKYFPRSFSSYLKYRFGLSRPKTVPPRNIKEFSGQ